MKALEINFASRIHDYEISRFARTQGPLFHRWLPNGRDDAITVEFENQKATAYLWFERRGFVDDSGWIQYSHDRKEVDASVIPRQAILEGGAVFGALELRDITEEEYDAVINQKVGDEPYETLGKRVVKQMIDPLLVRFTRILRDTYGQYWIEVPDPFDSRDCSLGQHCLRRFMSWRTESGESGKFVPNEPKNEPIHIFGTFSDDFSDYISENTWSEIGELVASGYEPSTADEIASRTNRLMREDKISYALIEGVTSLEISIDEHVRKHIKDDALFKSTKAWSNLPLPNKLTIVASLAGIEPEFVKGALKAIEERNKIVHEAANSDAKAEEYLSNLLKVISALRGRPRIRFPTAHPGNKLKASADDWQ